MDFEDSDRRAVIARDDRFQRSRRVQGRTVSTVFTRGFRSRGIASRRPFRGVAVVELAVLLPLLVFLFLLAIDFARVFYFSLSLTNCARAGALYASDPSTADESPFASVQAAALAEATNFSPQPTIVSTSGTDSSGRRYVSVTANYTFQAITGFPGIPSQVPLQRTVTMFESAASPNTN
jgi:Flp pilus assembly protein TadG